MGFVSFSVTFNPLFFSFCFWALMSWFLVVFDFDYFWRWSGTVLPLLLVFPMPLPSLWGSSVLQTALFHLRPSLHVAVAHSCLFLCPLSCSGSRHPVASWVWLLGCRGHVSLSRAQATWKPFLACHLSCSCVPVLGVLSPDASKDSQGKDLLPSSPSSGRS